MILNFNHKVLYSPSDYKNENIFLKTFEKDLSKVEKATKELNEKVKNKTVNQEDFYLNTLSRIMRIAEVSPRAAISEIWREVEVVTNNLLKSYGYEPKNVQMSKIFRNIVHENGYSLSFYEEYRQLMQLRNRAVHAEEFDLSQREAERYIHTALNLAVFIKKLSTDAPNKANSADAKSRTAERNCQMLWLGISKEHPCLAI